MPEDVIEGVRLSLHIHEDLGGARAPSSLLSSDLGRVERPIGLMVS